MVMLGKTAEKLDLQRMEFIQKGERVKQERRQKRQKKLEKENMKAK